MGIIPDPRVRFVWEGRWTGGTIELDRRIYDCELVYVSRGAFQLTVGAAAWTLTAGHVAIVPPAVVHRSVVPRGGQVVRHCVHFDWLADDARDAPLFAWVRAPFRRDLVHQPPAPVLARLPLVADLSERPSLRAAMDAALRLLRTDDPLGAWQLGVVLRALVDPPPLPVAAAARLRRSRERVLAAARHIDLHFADPLDHAELRRLAGLGSSQLCARFLEVVGRRPLAYLREVRLRHAERLLAEEDIPVAVVAAQVGIPDQNYFTRLFRRETGATPTAYRARVRARTAARGGAASAWPASARTIRVGRT